MEITSRKSRHGSKFVGCSIDTGKYTTLELGHFFKTGSITLFSGAAKSERGWAGQARRAPSFSKNVVKSNRLNPFSDHDDQEKASLQDGSRIKKKRGKSCDRLKDTLSTFPE